jgi:GTP-binding protein EngB required for normal cell division
MSPIPWVVYPIGIGVAILVRKWLKSDESRDDAPSSNNEQKDNKKYGSLKHRTLITNLKYLKSDLESKKGIKIAVVGQPGAGKSSLICNLTKNKCKPLPQIGTKTDMTDWSTHVFTDANFPYVTYKNCVIIDSPGYNTTKHPIEEFIHNFPFSKFDHILMVIRGKLHAADMDICNVMEDLRGVNCHLVRSFSDELYDNGDKGKILKDYRDKAIRLDATFISNKTKEGIRELSQILNM